MVRSVPPPSADEIVGQLFFEAAARRDGMTIERRAVSHRDLRLDLGREIIKRYLLYGFAIDVPVYDEERLVTLAIPSENPLHPRVYIDGPRCLRHRYADDALCMWFRKDSAARRWVVSEGLLALVPHVEEHAYCEARCRAGDPWPKEEAPGAHPRRPHCPSCKGKGR